MSQFKPTRDETYEVKYVARECEHNAKRAMAAENIYDRRFYEKKAGIYSAEAFALSQQIAARDAK
jgi:hypothetical protein